MNPEQTLIFRLGKERLGLPLSIVVEVFDISAPPAPVPGAPRWIGGIVNHHGQVIPVIRTGEFMEAGGGDGWQVILVDLLGEKVGLAVEQVESLEEVRADGPATAGRRRCWRRGALLELIDAEYMVDLIKERLAADGRGAII